MAARKPRAQLLMLVAKRIATNLKLDDSWGGLHDIWTTHILPEALLFDGTYMARAVAAPPLQRERAHDRGPAVAQAAGAAHAGADRRTPRDGAREGLGGAAAVLGMTRASL